ncbi:hypothetical protein ACMAY9_11045 [Porticoccaceae bacterium nBUS_09]
MMSHNKRVISLLYQEKKDLEMTDGQLYSAEILITESSTVVINGRAKSTASEILRRCALLQAI